MSHEYQNYKGQILGENPSGETKRIQVDENGNLLTQATISNQVEIMGFGQVDTAPVLDPDQLTANQLGLLRGLLKQLQDGTMKTSVVGSLANQETLGVDVTSDTVAVELTTGLVDRKQLIIFAPVDGGTIYYGTTPDNLAVNGLPLSTTLDMPFVVYDFAVAGGFPIYAVNDGTSRNVRVGESK